MLQEVKLVIEELSAVFVRGPEGSELYALLSLTGIGLSLWLLVLLYQRRRSRPVVSLVEPSEAREDHSREEPAQPIQEIAAAQAELREIVQGFSNLAAQVLRALERDGESKRPADPQHRVSELVELGLNQTEVARVIGLTVGEVALLMNLQKARLGTDRHATTPSSDGESVLKPVHTSNGQSGLGQIEDARS